MKSRKVKHTSLVLTWHKQKIVYKICPTLLVADHKFKYVFDVA